VKKRPLGRNGCWLFSLWITGEQQISL